MSEQLALIDTGRAYRDRQAEWDKTEAYYSRPEYVAPLLTYLHRIWTRRSGIVIEPCVGGGSIIDGLRGQWDDIDTRVCTGDVRDVGADWIGDWTGSPDTWTWNREVREHLQHAALVVTNPPFSAAIDVVEAAWRHCPHADVAILQRASWYEPTAERGPWLRVHNPDQITIGRCEFFRPDGSSAGKGDSCSYTWYVWGHERKGPRGGHHEIIPWKEAP
jgi:hypothetical protein